MCATSAVAVSRVLGSVGESGSLYAGRLWWGARYWLDHTSVWGFDSHAPFLRMILGRQATVKAKRPALALGYVAPRCLKEPGLKLLIFPQAL